MSKQKTVWEATQEIAFIKFLRDQIARLTDDDQAIRDTLEGELESGQFEDIMNALIHERNVALSIAEARKAYAKRLQEEAAVSEEYADRIKSLIGEGMLAAQRQEWKGTLGSVSWGKGQLQAIPEEGKVPIEFYKPVLDKAGLKATAINIHKNREAIMADDKMSPTEKEAALKEMPQIKGVTVQRGPDVLTIRSARD